MHRVNCPSAPIIPQTAQTWLHSPELSRWFPPGGGEASRVEDQWLFTYRRLPARLHYTGRAILDGTDLCRTACKLFIYGSLGSTWKHAPSGPQMALLPSDTWIDNVREMSLSGNYLHSPGFAQNETMTYFRFHLIKFIEMQKPLISCQILKFECPKIHQKKNINIWHKSGTRKP